MGKALRRSVSIVIIGLTILATRRYVSSGPLDHQAELFMEFWLLASILATLALVAWSNHLMAKTLYMEIGRLNNKSIQRDGLARHSSLLWILTGLIAFAVILGIYLFGSIPIPINRWWAWHPRIAEFLSGPILVVVVALFDFKLFRTYHWLHSQSQMFSTHASEEVMRVRERVDDARRVFWQIDMPILAGVSVAVLITSLLESSPVSHGFSAGAIAFQLIVGNVAFELQDQYSGVSSLTDQKTS